MGAFEIFYWLTLNLFALAPVVFLAMRRKIAFAPAILYGLAAWALLVLGLLFVSFRHEFSEVAQARYQGYQLSYGIRFYLAALITFLPVYFITITTAVRQNVKLTSRPIGPGLYLIRQGRTVFFGVWVVAFIGMSVYVGKYGWPPLFSAVDLGSSSRIYQLRMDITYRDEYREYVDYFLFWPPFAAVLGHCLYMVGRLTRMLNLTSLTLAAILGFSFLHKDNILFLIVQILLVFGIFGQLSTRRVMVAIAASLTILMLAYLFYDRGASDFSSQIASLMTRVIGTYNLSLDFVVNAFPDQIPFFFGATFPNPGGLLPFEPTYLSNRIMQELAGKQDGTVPVAAVGAWYANFGFAGSLGAAAVITGWLTVLVASFKFCIKSPVLIAVWVTFVSNVVRFSLQDIWVVLDVKGTLMLMLIGIVFGLVPRKNATGIHRSSIPSFSDDGNP